MRLKCVQGFGGRKGCWTTAEDKDPILATIHSDDVKFLRCFVGCKRFDGFLLVCIHILADVSF